MTGEKNIVAAKRFTCAACCPSPHVSLTSLSSAMTDMTVRHQEIFGRPGLAVQPAGQPLRIRT